jgi:hypothetical protein
MMDKYGRFPDDEHIKAIQLLAYPKEDIKDVRGFLGMTGFYREYIENYGDLIMPLCELLQKGTDIKKVWNKKHEESVDKIKEILTSKPVLRNIDTSKPFKLVVDACRVGRGIGAILYQEFSDGWHPVSYWSKSLKKKEREYSPTELEAKGLHDAIMRYSTYLRFGRFTAVTDHNSLLYMVKGQDHHNNGRLMRYMMDLQGYDFELIYKKGDLHVDADGVSRLLQSGEVVEFLSKDDLNTDFGPISEIEIELNKKRKEKIDRIIAYKEQLKNEKVAKEMTLNNKSINMSIPISQISTAMKVLENDEVYDINASDIMRYSNAIRKIKDQIEDDECLQ